MKTTRRGDHPAADRSTDPEDILRRARGRHQSRKADVTDLAARIERFRARLPRERALPRGLRREG